jgi:hypothetical protein
MPRNKYTIRPASPPPRTVITQTNTNSDNDVDHNPAMQHTSSIPEPSSSPKSQLHDAIERIQALHKRRTQIKTIYENERAYLDQRSQKTKSSFEGLIVSTEEQIQSINEVGYLLSGEMEGPIELWNRNQRQTRTLRGQNGTNTRISSLHSTATQITQM